MRPQAVLGRGQRTTQSDMNRRADAPPRLRHGRTASRSRPHGGTQGWLRVKAASSEEGRVPAIAQPARALALEATEPARGACGGASDEALPALALACY